MYIRVYVYIYTRYTSLYSMCICLHYIGTRAAAIIMPFNAMKYAHNKSNLSVVIFISATISFAIAAAARRCCKPLANMVTWALSHYPL